MDHSDEDLSSISSMRDVFDYCKKHKLHSVAQGMIELSPPEKLRAIAGALVTSGEDVHTYRDRFGTPEYRESVCSFLKKRYDTDVPVESILATAGVTGGIISTFQMLRTQSKRKVGLIEPFYTYHDKQVQAVLGCSPAAYIPSNKDFSPNFSAIESAIESGLDAVVVCNPGNPHGRCWKKEEMQKLVNITTSSNTLLVIDEIYCDMVFGKECKHYSPIQDEINPLVIVCRGFSKTLAIQSWRIGYTVSHPDTIKTLMPLHDPIYICVSWVQHAVARYLREHTDDYDRHTGVLCSMLSNNWKTLSSAFVDVMGWKVAFEPQGAMYGMMFHSQETDTEALKEGLKKGVGVSPGNIFFGGSPSNTGYIRIHMGMTSEHAMAIATALRKTKECV